MSRPDLHPTDLPAIASHLDRAIDDLLCARMALARVVPVDLPDQAYEALLSQSPEYHAQWLAFSVALTRLSTASDSDRSQLREAVAEAATSLANATATLGYTLGAMVEQPER